MNSTAASRVAQRVCPSNLSLCPNNIQLTMAVIGVKDDFG